MSKQRERVESGQRKLEGKRRKRREKKGEKAKREGKDQRGESVAAGVGVLARQKKKKRHLKSFKVCWRGGREGGERKRETDCL